MKVLIATTQVPFMSGGAEVLANSLQGALRAAGHQAEIVAIPFKWYPAERIVDQMLACRLLDLEEASGAKIDRVIGLKFPAYLIPHPHKVLWLVHQHRQAYDLWNHPLGDLHLAEQGREVRAAIHQADTQLIPEFKSRYSIAGNVSRRLAQHCGLSSTPLYPPPQDAEQFHSKAAEDYFFFPSRLSASKRQTLVLEALAHTREPVRVRFAGAGSEPGQEADLAALTRRLGLEDRVQWLGNVAEAEKRELYARCLAVVYPPLDEDYGYITLEAMLASKAVVTCTDSGGPLEFVEPERTGLTCDASPVALAAALDRLWKDRGFARELGIQGRKRYDQLDMSWPHVVQRLVA